MLVLVLAVCELHQVHCARLEDQLSEIRERQDAIDAAKQFQEIDLEKELEDPEDEAFPFKRKRERNVSLSCLTRYGFITAIKALGITKLPGVKLGTIPRNLVRYLEKHKELTIPVKFTLPTTRPPKYRSRFRNRERKPRPRSKKQDEKVRSIFQNDDEGAENDDDSVVNVQKRSERPLCADKLMVTTVLARPGRGSEAYQIQTRQCEGSSCQSRLFSAAYNNPIGRCAMVQTTMLLYIVDANRMLVPQTFNFGTACECLSPFP